MKIGILSLLSILLTVFGCKSKSKKDLKKTYYSSGELKSYGFFKSDSIPVDTLVTLFKDGKKSSVEIFDSSGDAVKTLTFYENGNLHKLINYKHGLANGFFLTYDSSDIILNKAFYYNDTQIGNAFFYYKDSLVYNFYDWNGDNTSQIVYDSDFNIEKDQRQVIFIDSVRFKNDTTIKDNSIINTFQQDLLIVLSNPPKCKTDLIIKYLSKKDFLIETDSSTNIQVFKKKTFYPDSLTKIIISGKEYDSITKKTTYQLTTKVLNYDLKLIPLTIQRRNDEIIFLPY